MWIKYKNGNYMVYLNTENGTKIRHNKENFMKADRVECMDVKISNRCSHNCSFCHEGSSINGELANLYNVTKFAETIPPYTEVAVGGGNIMEDIVHAEQCLKIFKDHNLFCSITIRQDDFLNYYDIIEKWNKENLVYGIGVSLTSPSNKLKEKLKSTPNSVLHIIAGIVTPQELEIIKKWHVKILILGYKQLRRGLNYFKWNNDSIIKNMNYLSGNILNFINGCEVCSFDNLAIEQLRIQEVISIEDWNKFYMGDDGTTSFYVDLVSMQYARSSISDVRYLITDIDCSKMFERVKNAKD